jgi:diguanylate cyclase (GGDEF)-like protein/PAS domain S-box-containing protein
VNTKAKARAPGNPRLLADARAQLARAPKAKGTVRPAEELLHELQVHQMELEMQNEELRRAQVALEESRDRYMDLYEFAPVGYLTVTAEGLISEVNHTGATLLHLPRKKLLQRRFANLIVPRDRDRWHRLFISVLRHEERQDSEFALERGNGVAFPARLDCARVAAGDTPPAARITLTDISERKRSEAALRVAAVAFEAQEGIVVTDNRTVIQRVNRSFTEITGYSAEEAVGQTPGMMKSGRHDATFYAAMWETIQRTGAWQGEIWNRRKNGEVFLGWLTITAVKGGEGDVTHYVGMMTDITQRKAAEAEIERLAFFDLLTQLPNRRLLLDRLGHALAARARTRRQGALLFIDLDNFKILNDTRGHHIGDVLLRQVAQQLSKCVRQSDTVARLGGDEFVVVLERLSESPQEAVAEAETIGKKILATLGETCMLVDKDHDGTASVGIAMFGDPGETAEDLLQRADLAMYEAKAAGRNTLRFFDQGMQAAINARAAFEADLRRAVRDGPFILLYQPQVDREGCLMGAEALVRWQHPRRGLIDPIEFIPAAEKFGLIVPLGQWVLRAACAEAATWGGNPNAAGVKLAVNVSAPEFHEPDFVERLLAVLDCSGADPRRLTLEFTESLLLYQSEATIDKMTRLKARGVRFSLDDFGVGYSSLSYLKHLPLDQVKIDRCFVRDVLTDPNDATIAAAIVALGHSLNLSVMAEGVETAEQWEFLAGLGCDAFQGYLFGRPGSVEALWRIPGAQDRPEAAG